MRTITACVLTFALTATTLPAAELWIGGTSTSITPDKPVAAGRPSKPADFQQSRIANHRHGPRVGVS